MPGRRVGERAEDENRPASTGLATSRARRTATARDPRVAAVRVAVSRPEVRVVAVMVVSPGFVRDRLPR